MYITIIGAKIFYGDTLNDMLKSIGAYKGKHSGAVSGLTPNAITYVQMTEMQFVRFKNAGRRKASSKPGKQTTGGISRTRVARTGTHDPLEKWDVDFYGDLTGHAGPWGNGSLTNRDHMTANSSNQMRNKQSGHALSTNEVKNQGVAITVSGEHHRRASYTYGGRTKSPSPVLGLNRMEFGAKYPTDAFMTELDTMLEWKRDGGTGKNRLRIEMVGAYTYMYKFSVDTGVVTPSVMQDQKLLNWIAAAVANDDGKIRK